jgi:hypothetical protein
MDDKKPAKEVDPKTWCICGHRAELHHNGIDCAAIILRGNPRCGCRGFEVSRGLNGGPKT